MASYNRVVMIGNLTRDPEHKQLASGQAVCRLGLATNRQFKNKASGTMVQEVCFIDIDVWGPQAESCRQYLSKGRPVLIEGRLKFDTWQDQAGQTRSKHSIVADRVVFLASGQEASASNEAQAEGENAGFQSESTLDPEVERELTAQIDQIKRRVANNDAAALVKKAVKADEAKPAKKVAGKKEETADGSFVFQDEPPFQDDLPF